MRTQANNESLSDKNQDKWSKYMTLLADQNMSCNDFAREIGLSTSTTHGWQEQHYPVPQYALAYLELRLKCKRLERYAKLF